MRRVPDGELTAALTFNAPQRKSWAVRDDGRSSTGKGLATLVDYLARHAEGRPVTLSLSIIFELTGSGETLRSLSNRFIGDD